MKKSLGFIYNRVFHILNFTEDEKEDSAAVSAWFFCSTISSLFILDILLALTGSTKILIIDQGIWYLTVFVLNVTIYYFLTYHKKKYLKIVESFKDEQKITAIIGSIAVFSFSAAVIVLFFVLGD